MPQVRCSVGNCAFWGQGNFCQANEIVVQTESNESAYGADGAMQSSLLSGELQSSAFTSVETCCHTFQPR